MGTKWGPKISFWSPWGPKSPNGDQLGSSVKVVRNKNMWARLEIERQFLNEYNLLDDGINVNL